MARNISTELQNAAAANVVEPLILVEAEFDSYDLRMWSGLGDLTWDAKTWTGGGSLLTIDAIEETVEVKAVGTRVTLSGIPSELLSLALQEDYQGRTLRVYIGAFVNGSIVANPIVIFSGRMDVMTITESGTTSSIELTVENRLIDFERTKERRYTDQDQKIDYPNDKGFEFVNAIQDVEIVWGRS